MSSALFVKCFNFTVSIEGGYTNNPNDPGNWTSGICGEGECRGTKYGISAAAHPNLNISSLTYVNAQTIYELDYWSEVRGDELQAPPLALLAFDAAVNNGASHAIRWLQRAVKAYEDGDFGPGTLAAVHAQCATPGGLETVMIEYLSQRLIFMSLLNTWKTFDGGWSRRLIKLPFAALAMAA